MATLHRQFRFHSSLFLWDFVWKLGKNSVKKQQPGTLWRSPEDSVERKWKLGKTKKKKRKKWRSRKAKQINGGTGSVDGFQIFVMTIKKAERLHFCLLFARWFLFYGGDSFDDFFFPFFFGPYAGSNRIPKWRKSKCCVHWAKKNSVKVPKTDSPSPNHAENPVKLGKNSVKE